MPRDRVTTYPADAERRAADRLADELPHLADDELMEIAHDITTDITEAVDKLRAMESGEAGQAHPAPRAFMKQPGDEHMLDQLGFWDFGRFRGEWSGTSAWLADMPLPMDVIGDLPVTDMTSTLPAITRVREAVAAGDFTPTTIGAPREAEGGHVKLELSGYDKGVDPNFVAHIERGMPGGVWAIVHAEAKMKNEDEAHDVVVYIVDGVARALVAPSHWKRPEAADAF